MIIAPSTAIFPGFAIVFRMLAFNLLGDGLYDVLDPKLKFISVGLLEIEGLSVDIDGTPILRASSTIDQGEVMGLVGESGSGKSMTALAVIGMLRFPPRRHQYLQWRQYPCRHRGPDVAHSATTSAWFSRNR